jgi:spore coat protein U domain-containing protein, fimbrial subunit CupE1/2/3/6
MRSRGHSGKNSVLFTVGALMSMVLVTPAKPSAGQLLTNMAVSATGVAGCQNFSSGGLSFGNYPSSSATPIDSTATVNITCTNGVGWTLDADTGLHFSGISGSRNMDAGGSGTLAYSLYTDSGRTTSFIGASKITGVANGSQQSVTIYGRIPAGQGVAAAAYTDTVVLTLTF